MIPSMFNTFALVNVQDGNARKTFMMSAASIYGGPCLLIALALTTLERPSEIVSDKFISRSPLSLSGVGC